MIDEFLTALRIESRAKVIVEQCIQAGGFEELRRVARLGLPLNRQIEDDSPELRQQVQEIADRLSRYQPLWLSGFRLGVVGALRWSNSLQPQLLATAPLAAD